MNKYIHILTVFVFAFILTSCATKNTNRSYPQKVAIPNTAVQNGAHYYSNDPKDWFPSAATNAVAPQNIYGTILNINETSLTDAVMAINTIKEATFTKCGDSYYVYTDHYGHIYNELRQDNKNGLWSGSESLNEFRDVSFSPPRQKQLDTRITKAEVLNGVALHEGASWGDWVGRFEMKAKVVRSRSLFGNGNKIDIGKWGPWRDGGFLRFSVNRSRGSWTYKPGDYLDIPIKTTTFRKPSCNDNQ